jgi:anion-transporting  ArsA/GET3 family ATPase
VNRLPRVVFVLGKGGVGRSTVAAALGLQLARQGRRACVFGWTLADPIAPWFGATPAGLDPRPVAPRLHVANYRLDDTLELYFVHHLRLPRVYRHVIRGTHVRRLIEAAPGIAELFFVGHIWWLTSLAATEAGLEFDHVVVDAPATGHGASLFDIPSLLRSLRSTGLLALETDRVTRMMADPAWTGAVVVALPEELSVDETVELVPRVSERTGRRPLALLVNRSVQGADPDHSRATLETLRARLSPAARQGLDSVYAEFEARRRFEAILRMRLAGATEHGVVSLKEQLALPGEHTPLSIVQRLATQLATAFGPDT